MSIYCGHVGLCHWSHHHGVPSDADWSALFASVKVYYDELAQQRQRGCMITVTWKTVAPDARRRKDIADSIMTGPLAAYTLVTDSRAIQLVVTALNWLVKRSHPEQTFTEVRAALDWLHAQCPFDRAAVVDAMLRAVPPQERDPSLSLVYAEYARGA